MYENAYVKDKYIIAVQKGSKIQKYDEGKFVHI